MVLKTTPLLTVSPLKLQRAKFHFTTSQKMAKDIFDWTEHFG
jgi:hypothetical protein